MRVEFEGEGSFSEILGSVVEVMQLVKITKVKFLPVDFFTEIL